MDLPNNARVDILGTNHEGKHIFRVIVDGLPAPMYMVDAASDTVDKNGKAILKSPIKAVVEGEVFPHVAQQGFAEKQFSTIVVPYDPDAEPPVKGTMLNGLNKAWVDWYRLQGKGHSLLEACEEGLRRLGDTKAAEWADAPEPALIPRFPGSTLPTQEWVTWYRRVTGAGIQDAVAEGQFRISQLPKQ